ncbi:TIR-like protein FxsC [Dactylosporangium sp. NPDC000521]|uniref:TIR-like protein FxsC n=1 Tax=Dactylosporangium sp. NPDC000521 TaxID=3363975 RepID=UPI0036C5AB29
MYFFLSYAQGDDQDGDVLAFYRDLSREVADLAGCRPEEAGHIDGQIPLGSDWSRELDHAVNTADCLVALTSPRYVRSEFCGREFGVFVRRVERHVAVHGVHPPALIPLRWIPSPDLPAVVKQYQYRNASTGPVYAQDGLKTLRRRQKHADLAAEFVLTLARHIVQTARQHPLHRITPPLRLSETPDAFAAPAPAPAPAQDKPATPPGGDKPAAPPGGDKPAAPPGGDKPAAPPGGEGSAAGQGGRCTIHIQGSQGVQIGDNIIQHNTWS